MTDDALAETLATIRERTTPDPAERERLETVTERLVERAEAAVASLPAPADEATVLRVGSTARGTWLPGDRDVDLFVRFPTTLDRTELERYGLRVGHEVLPEGREEYAEHPYVVGRTDGFDVDLVPCFDVPDATAIRSAVDRTPFHTAYLAERLDEDRASEVRVTKQFLTAIGAYGSDLRTEGFSGYLTELLVLAHGDARSLFEAVADWEPPVRYDPADHGTATFADPLVVIDPTDPERNVAAVCSSENVARFQHHARAVMADPTPDRFEPDSVEPISRETVRDHLDRRGTDPIAVVFDAPDVVDDQLFPQLRRSLAGIERGLGGHGFEVVRSAVWTADEERARTDDVRTVDHDADGSTASGGEKNDHDTSGGEGIDANTSGGEKNDHDTSGGEGIDADTSGAGGQPVALVVELTTARLPAVERHEGPPVGVRDHAEGFSEAYADRDVYGPFLDGDRYVVERERSVRDAAAWLDADGVFDVALGARVEDALADDYSVHAGEDCARLADRFGRDAAVYFDPRV